ncbi:MAG: DUF2911 domain-containing protein [Cryomorphaceae bacterium]|nr:DUF2911 domain-containing protein [Cryomorphaceae bacterium]
MKKIISLFSLSLFVGLVNAQELPTPSSKASVEQRIGLTDIRIDYHRPSANDRVVFGELVPFGQLWRTGANKATSITFSTDVKMMGKNVPAGTYSLFTIPNKTNWVIVLNKETELWGTGNYQESQDVLRVEVPNKTLSEKVETFTIGFDNISIESGHLCLSWENRMACISIEVDAAGQALENINAAVSAQPDDWSVLRKSASYYMDHDIDNVQALLWMKKSVELKDDNWYSYYLLGRAQMLNGKNKDAVKSAEKALEMHRKDAASRNQPVTYEKMLTEAINSWKKKK